MADMEEPDPSAASEDVPPIVDVEVNPEGYGIEGDFVPTAVFEVIEEKPPPTEDTLFEGSDISEKEGVRGEEGDEEKLSELEASEGEEQSEKDKEDEQLGEEGGGETTDEAKEHAEGAVEKKEEGEVKGEEIKKEVKESVEEIEGGEAAEKTAVKFGVEQEPGAKKKLKKEVFKRRLSIRKKSIFYQAQSRFRAEDRRVSGDFKAIQEDLLGDIGTPPSIVSFQPESGEYSFEEEVEEEEIPPIDREYYYNIYKALTPVRTSQKIKNNYLQRKMADYFKKRKMEHVLKETDQQIDSQAKYVKKLDALSELRDLDGRERNCITTELNDMRSQRNDQRSMLGVHFAAMQSREKDIGSGLINTKTGKEIPDKLISHLLKRQRTKWMEIARMRLTYIKIRDRVAEKKTALHALDCIGDNLHLIDYEQLKIENQSHTDKIEERDEELTKLRIKCQGAMQCLAHIREKSAAVLLDIQQLNERNEEVEMEYTECRERLNYFKQERDRYRSETDKLCDESGLLSKPKLLQDMERAMEDVSIKSKELEDLKTENQRIATSLKCIKQNIKDAPTKVHTIKPPSVQFKSTAQKIYKGRPTLIYPQLPQSDWDDSANPP